MKPYYDEDGITIYHGDCREVLLGLTPDVVITDPPYGVGVQYGEDYNDAKGDAYAAFIAGFCEALDQTHARAVITPGIDNIWLYPPADWVLAWHKPGSTRRSRIGGFNEWEPVLLYGTPPGRVFHDAIRLPTAANLGDPLAGQHPCPKPLALMSWLVNLASTADEVVVDPFMGSGTTLRAAKNLGRRAIGIEIEEKYCEIAVQRLAQGVLDFSE